MADHRTKNGDGKNKKGDKLQTRSSVKCAICGIRNKEDSLQHMCLTCFDKHAKNDGSSCYDKFLDRKNKQLAK